MKRDVAHVCSDCGLQSAKWHGQCPSCGSWNTMVEERVSAPARDGGRGRSAAISSLRAMPGTPPVLLSQVEAARVRRLQTGIGELDRVLGGGLVPGSLVLLGGSPGIGKSTLTNMALGNLAAAGHRTLYVSGEESAEQVRLRAERLTASALDVPVLAETDLDAVLDAIAVHEPAVCVIDSVQTLRCADLSGAPGSVGQVREVAGQVMELAKQRQVAVVLVGHVTKEGALAGPRVLEHLVDCVLQFEGERERPYRELRALKNRFGSTNEAGLFEMRQGGLVEVIDASARFVAEATRAPGSVVLATMEGSRPLLVEVQALVADSELEQPRRVVSGLDRNRLALVLAILARHGGIGLGGHPAGPPRDVFVNVVGGVRVEEPGVDLAIALAVASAARGVALHGSPCACFGELGLTGELRWVGHPERRLEEAARHGLHGVLAPPGSSPASSSPASSSPASTGPDNRAAASRSPSGGGADTFEAATLREALASVFPTSRTRPEPLAA
jgi:DNA repair protein RadA/Sms